MRVVFVRHGESTGNAGVPCFDLSKLTLTRAGLDQASSIAAGWQHQPTLIALSPYVRTHLTAEPTRARFPEVAVEVLPMEEFTYLEPARWNGTSRQDRLPHIDAYWEAADPAYSDGPGAESFETLLWRVDRTLSRLQALPVDAFVYAFSHGQFMQAVRVSLLYPDRTSKQKMRCFWPFNAKFPILNAGRVEARYENNAWSTPEIEI
jgi:broad specificity phosphatase PhoE